jgi:hypothetical protein
VFAAHGHGKLAGWVRIPQTPCKGALLVRQSTSEDPAFGKACSKGARTPCKRSVVSSILILSILRLGSPTGRRHETQNLGSVGSNPILGIMNIKKEMMAIESLFNKTQNQFREFHEKIIEQERERESEENRDGYLDKIAQLAFSLQEEAYTRYFNSLDDEEERTRCNNQTAQMNNIIKIVQDLKADGSKKDSPI